MTSYPEKFILMCTLSLSRFAARAYRHSVLLPVAVWAACGLCASCGEDRSGEQPFAPTVGNVSVTVDGDSARLTGQVTASPNSTLTECGFVYGNDTLRAELKADAPAELFSVVADSLERGAYYAVAYARNGVGRSYAPDTLLFLIP